MKQRIDEAVDLILSYDSRAHWFTRTELTCLAYEATKTHAMHGGSYWAILENLVFMRSIEWGKLPQNNLF